MFRYLTIVGIALLLYPAAALAQPTDPLFQEQTNLHAVGVDAVGAWETTKGAGAVICLIDDGIDWLHDDIRNSFALNAKEIPGLPPLGANGILDIDDFWGIVTGSNGAPDVPALLLQYSDGIDNDGNGYIDDISGWDFDDDDNDPYDLWNDGHGMGRAGILVASENGVGSVGLAPEAHLLIARVGDKILHTPDALAEAVAYCADNGADSINMSLGGLGGSSMLRAAFEYALRKGVISANASGNEGHYHHNFNAVFDSVIAVGSVIEAASPEGMWTEKNNTTDYGAKLALAAPTDSWTVMPFSGAEYRREGGTSSATPHVAAAVALVKQAARAQGLTLSAGEVRQILQGSATDITGTKWAATPGWDPFTGYGRVDYRDALAWVKEERIPAEADIDSPGWFQVVNPAATPVIPITGHVFSRQAKAQYELFVGVGVRPLEWRKFAEASIGSAYSGNLLRGSTLLEGATADGLDISTLEVMRNDPIADTGDPQSFAVTIKLVVTPLNEVGKPLPKLQGEDRQTFYVVADADMRAGFPLQNTASIEAGILAVDLDGDGTSEIIIGDSDGVVKAMRGDGSFLWRTNTLPLLRHAGAPAFQTGNVKATFDPVVGSPAAADLDGDGRIEVVAPGLNGHIYAWRHDGSAFWPAPLTTDTSRYPGETNTRARVYGNIVLADLDGDALPEVLAVAQDQQLYAWHGDGKRVSGFPVFLSTNATLADVSAGNYRPVPAVSTPGVGDLNGDGQADIVVGTNEIDRNFFGHIYAIDGRGRAAPKGPFLEGWPVSTVVSPFGLPVVGEGVSGGITLTDLESDGFIEVIGGGFSGNAAIWNHDGSLRLLLERNQAKFGAFAEVGEALLAGWTNAMATVGDIDGDGQPEIYAAGMGLGSFVETSLTEKLVGGKVPDTNHLMLAYNADGSFLPHFPRRIEGWSILTNPLLVDVDGDAVPEVIVGSSGYYLHAYRRDGSEPQGWPKFAGGWLFSTPAAADLDGDGRTSIVAAVREGQIFVWNTAGRMADAPYPQLRGTADRAGRITAFEAKSQRPSIGSGCGGCAMTGNSAEAWLWLGLAAAWAFRRRLARSVTKS